MPQLDQPLTPRPKISLSHLRDIGWTVWDPIGLLNSNQKWSDEDCLAFADEYDAYMMQAASQLQKGVAEAEVANYLVEIEVKHMGLELGRGVLERAKQVVAAILADKEIWTYPE